MTRSRILVGSTFIDGHESQLEWFNLQSKFLKATTRNFDQVIVVHDKSHIERFEDAEVLTGTTDGTHLDGLSQLSECFKSRRDRYDGFLFLDSDAFPIKRGWDRILPRKMAYYKTDIAAAQRHENLDPTIVHASILFVPSEQIDNISFELDLSIGFRICVPEYESQGNKVLPLVRSNFTNIDPILCGIHYGMFYHHACGSREYRCRGTKYWKGIMPFHRDVVSLSKSLFEDPDEFLAKLVGESYVRLLS